MTKHSPLSPSLQDRPKSTLQTTSTNLVPDRLRQVRPPLQPEIRRLSQRNAQSNQEETL